MQRYVAWSLGYEFPELTNFFARLEDLILKVNGRVWMDGCSLLFV